MAESKELQREKASKRHKRNAASLQLIPNESGNGYSFSSLGFKYGDFNRAGLLGLPAVFRHFETMRYRILSAFGLDTSELQTFFVLQVRAEISTELYKTPGIAVKLKNISDVLHVGNSTITFRTIMMNETSGVVLAIHYWDNIHVNAKTRKAEPFPADFKQKVQKMLSMAPIQSPQRLRLPAVDRRNCYCCKLVVRNIDMDGNDHTTQVMYVEYALEIAAQATSSGYYKKLQGDICGYGVKNAQFVHTGESAAGDELLLMTWEDESNPLLIYFVIRKDSKDVCHAKIEFYDPYVHSNI